MVKLQPQPFTTERDVIATFSFNEILEGSGTTVFYGTAQTDDTSTLYSLTATTRNSDPILTKADAINHADPQKTVDVDFDIEFNIARTLNGRVVFDLPIGWANNTLNNADLYVICVLTNETTSTTLSTTQSETWASGTVDTHRKRIVMADDLTNINFSRGDVLRLNVQVWTYLAPAAGNLTNVTINHDPLTTTAAVEDVTTDLKLHVPFRIDI